MTSVVALEGAGPRERSSVAGALAQRGVSVTRASSAAAAASAMAARSAHRALVVTVTPALSDDELAEAVNQIRARWPAIPVLLLYPSVAAAVRQPPARVDAAIVARDPEEAAAICAATLRAMDAPDATLDHADLAGLSFLDVASSSALDAAQVTLAHAFDADRGRIWLASTGQPEPGETVVQRGISHDLTLAHSCGGLLIGHVGDLPDGEVASVLAAPSGCAGDQYGLAVIVRGVRWFTRLERRLLRSLADRFASERAQNHVAVRLRNDYETLSEGPCIDPVLGVWNRPGLVALTEMRASEAQRANKPLLVAVIDVGIQDINRRYGHASGDLVLRHVALLIGTAVRGHDIVGRYSGGRLAVALPGSTRLTAEKVLERAITRLQEKPCSLSTGENIPIRLSYGLADCGAGGDSVSDALAAAAEASSGPSEPKTRKRRTLSFLDDNESGAILAGTYRLRYEISRGGIGVVYRAEDIRLGRPVAIKMLHPDLASDDSVVELFNAEAALLAAIEHPNIVEVYASGCEDGVLYFVMELVEGESLQDYIDRLVGSGESVSLARIRDVVTQIASALDALHEREIFHSDVKPGNVVLDPFRGRAVLIDVGIARWYGDASLLAGTPGYMAPEIASGARANRLTDIYGLAATAFAMVTLNDPFPLDLPYSDLIARQLTGEPPRPSTTHPGLAALDGVFRSALSPRAAERPTTAGAFAQSFAASAATISGDTLSAAVGPAESGPEPPASPAIIASEQTRGLVFRSVARVLGVRSTHKLEAKLVNELPELSRALARSTAPMEWLSAATFEALLDEADARNLRRDFAEQLGRATVRSSFQRLFPASAATLSPAQTLMAIAPIWRSYQSWGTIVALPQRSHRMSIKLAQTLANHRVCRWTSGMLEQLVLLSRGRNPIVVHDRCEAHGDLSCVFDISWTSLDA